MRWLRRWALALRLALRDLRSHRRRAALLVALVGLPVLAAAAALVVVATAAVTPEERATHALGAASGRVNLVGPEQAARAGGDAALPGLLPAGARLLSDGWARLALRAPAGEVAVPVRLLDLADPLAQGLYVARSGQPARGPEEIVLSASLARRLGVVVGETVDMAPPGAPGREEALRVTGLVEDPADTRRDFAVLPPAAAPPSILPSGDERQWLLALPPGQTPEAAAERLRAAGYLLTPRAEVAQRAADPGAGRERGMILALEAFALGEVALVVGAAFAMIARAQRRELGLLAVVGAGPADRRRVVLAQGLVVGSLGALLGALGGSALGAALVPALAARAGAAWGPVRLPVPTLALLALVGLAATVLAAWLPAREVGRLAPIAALRDRDAAEAITARGSGRGTRVRAGLAVAFLAALGTGAVRRDGGLVALGGTGAFLLAIALVVPALRAARTPAERLTLVPRLAVRDASRAAGRTAALTAAVGGLVAFAVVLGVGLSGIAARSDAGYVPALPEATVHIPGPALTAAETAAVSRALPPLTRTGSYGLASLPPEPGAPVGARIPAVLLNPVLQCAASSGQVGGDLDRCTAGRDFRAPFPQLGAVDGDAAAVELVLGRALTGPERAALDAGQALVLNPSLLQPDGTLHLGTLESFLRSADGGPPAVRIPGRAVEGPVQYVDVPLAFVSVPALARHGLVLDPAGATLLGTTRRPTLAEQDRAQLLLTEAGQGAQPDRQLAVERGPQGRSLAARVLLLVTGGAALTALTVTVAGVALATTEMRADLAALAAVGAQPLLRRRLAAAQSGLLAALGVAVGGGVGLAAALALVRADSLPLVATPWPPLALLAIGVPGVAGLCAFLGVPSRLPMTRRVE